MEKSLQIVVLSHQSCSQNRRVFTLEILKNRRRNRSETGLYLIELIKFNSLIRTLKTMLHKAIFAIT